MGFFTDKQLLDLLLLGYCVLLSGMAGPIANGEKVGLRDVIHTVEQYDIPGLECTCLGKMYRLYRLHRG